MLSTIIK